jgi:hypothetical protein
MPGNGEYSAAKAGDHWQNRRFVTVVARQNYRYHRLVTVIGLGKSPLSPFGDGDLARQNHRYHRLVTVMARQFHRYRRLVTVIVWCAGGVLGAARGPSLI